MFSIQHGGAVPDGVPDPDLRHIPNVDGGTTHLFDDDVVDVFERLDQPDTANHIFFVVFLQDVPAGIRVVLRHGIEHIVKRQTVFTKQTRLDHHLVLFDEPSQGIHIHHIG